MKETIAIIGLGLMGGSLAKRIKQFRPECSIIGYDENREVILAAIDGKIIDKGYMQINQDIKKSNYIVVAIPPLVFPSVVSTLTAFDIPAQTIITDLLSVKTCCEIWIKEANLTASFVGGHPICGHDKSGFAHSHADFFDQGPYCLMAANTENGEAYAKWEAFLKSLGITTMDLTPEGHDELMAYVSHMPHAISYMMSHLALGKQDVQTLGKSFKEMTRISKSSARLWTDIFALNQKPLLHVLHQMKNEIVHLESLLEGKNQNALFHYLNESQVLRINREKEGICWKNGETKSILSI